MALQQFPLVERPYAGRIESIELTNFMSHEHIIMHMNPSINFLLGANGSGKSAIMSAAMVVLGSTARGTDRATNLQSFIKYGASQARVRISLSNRGVGEYMPEVYGASIVLTRTIARSGQATLYVRLPTREIKIDKADLDLILSAFHINLSNPLCITTQDTMRTFRDNAKPKKIFQLLLEGTGCQDLLDRHARLNSKMEKAKMDITYWEGVLEKKKICVNKLESRLENYSKYELARKEMDTLDCKLAWCRVLESEHKLDVHQEVIQQLQQDIEDLKESLIEAEENMGTDRVASTKSREDAVKNSIEDVQVRLVDVREQQSQCREDGKLCKKEHGEIEAEIRAKEKEVALLQADKLELQNIMQEIDVSKEKVENIRYLSERVAQLERELRDKVQTRKSIEVDTCQVLRDIGLIEENIMEKKENFKQFKQVSYKGCDMYDRVKKEISTIPPAYGLHMDKLIKKVEEANTAGHFTEKPLGPIGLYVKVKNPKWTLAVETCLKQELRTFYCNSVQDQAVLQQLAQSVMPNSVPPIVSSKFESMPFNTSKFRARPVGELVSLLDVLDISQPEVLNFLIDARRLEQVLLCDHQHYKRALEMISKLHTVPRNCSVIITSQGDQIYPQPQFRFYSSEQREPKFLVKDRSEGLQLLEEKCMQDKTEAERYLAEIKSLQEQGKSLHNKKRSYCERTKKLMVEECKLQQQIEEVKAKKEELGQDLLGLPVQLEENMLQQRCLAEDKEALVKRLAHCEQRGAVMESKMVEFTASLKSLRAELSSWKQRLRQVQGELEREKSRTDSTRKRLKESELRMEHLKRKRMVQGKKLRETVEKATILCPRMSLPADLTSENVLQEKNSQLAYVTSMQEQLTPQNETLELHIQEKKEEIQKMAVLLSDLKENHEKMCEAMKRLYKRYSEIITEKMLRISASFSLMFRNQNFVGKLRVDWEERSARVELYRNENLNFDDEDEEGDSENNFSGGENTLSAVALIASVWSQMRAPFFMVDEFDVFLDPLNRCAAIRMLQEEARFNFLKQFLFLTPQTTVLEETPGQTIHQLKSPRGHLNPRPYPAAHDEDADEQV